MKFANLQTLTKAFGLWVGRVARILRLWLWPSGFPGFKSESFQDKEPSVSQRFAPQTVIRDWGNGDAFRISDALSGCIIMGSTGSGKTSGGAKHLAFGYLAAGFGGLVLCAKPEESRQWCHWATETGRSADLIIIDANGTYCFNVMEWEASRPGEGGGFVVNLVALLDNIGKAINGGAGRDGSDKYWEQALHSLNMNAVSLATLAGVVVSPPLLRSIVSSAPTSLEQLNDPAWQGESECARALKDADAATANADAETRADFQECYTFWTKDFPALSDKTRSSILLSFTVLIHSLVTSPLRKLFSSDTNVRPEDTFDGKIIIVNIPVQEFRQVGQIANLIWKYCFQIAVLRRSKPESGFLRPVFLWNDECHNFVAEFDAEYQAVARSAGGCTVYLTQNRESLRRVLKNDDAVDALLSNLQAKLFFQNTGETNEYASKLLGERWLQIVSTSAGHTVTEATISNPESASRNSGSNRAEQPRRFVEAAVFTTLKRGGPLNNFQVQAIVFNGGHLFRNGNEMLPFKLLTFNQK